MSIDRIDNNGPYAPWNCRWTDAKTQAYNRENNRYLTVGDTRMILYDWMKLFNDFKLWCNRMYVHNPGGHGFTEEQAVTELSIILDDFARSIDLSTETTPVSKLISLYRECRKDNKQDACNASS